MSVTLGCDPMHRSALVWAKDTLFKEKEKGCGNCGEKKEISKSRLGFQNLENASE